VTFRAYAAEYLEWSRLNKRSWETDAARLKGLVAAFGDRRLDEITAADVERFRDGLLERCAQSTANRYRDLLSGLFKRAIRDGHATQNPVRAVSKFKENNERVTYLTDAEESAVWTALAPKHRPLFVVSVHSGLRWSEEVGLRWQDLDYLTGFITVPRTKYGPARRVPMNSVIRGVLMDLAGARRHPDDPRPTEPAHFFPKAVKRAAAAMQAAGEPAPHLDSYTWHGNRHTFSSRLVMAGVDLLTVQKLGGWRSLAMVQRYAHLSPGHLHAAVERLVPAAVEVSRFCPDAAPEQAALDSRRVTHDHQRARP
jgi:integrase